MSIIPVVGRKSFSIRIVIICIYLMLIVLGTTMVVPFMITISSSTANDFDYDRFSPVPRYLWSSEDRFFKGLVGYFNRYGKWYQQMQVAFPEAPDHWASWQTIGKDTEATDRLAQKYLGVSGEELKTWRLVAADYSWFMDNYPMEDTLCPVDDTKAALFFEHRYSFLYAKKHPEIARTLSRRKLSKKALELMSETWGAYFESFFNVGFKGNQMTSPVWHQSWFPVDTPSYRDFQVVKRAYRNHFFTPGVREKWLKHLKKNNYEYENERDVFPVQETSPPKLREIWTEFKARIAPASPTVPFAMRAVWYVYLKDSEDVHAMAGLYEESKNDKGGARKVKTFDHEVYNRLAGTNYKSLRKTPFPIPADYDEGIQKIWRHFVITRYPWRLTSIKVTDELQKRYEAFIEKRFKTVAYLNKLVDANKGKWSDFKLTATPPKGIENADVRSVWADFLKGLPAEEHVLNSSEIAFQKFLMDKYGDIETINKTYGWELTRIEEAFPPIDIAYAITFRENQAAFTFKPILANYKTISHFLLNNSNAIFVTFVLVSLTVLSSLTVNPVAAYALSRFNLRGQDKIILFMIATMAFPTMVTAIPAYLLMRDVGLLNTFFALILPSAANGMSIFILKGFFDSLPPELYEAATIDGAREWQIFLIVTMPMVKPILAINAMRAFIAAYNGWQWALIICQNKEMWTISVWLYQASMWWKDYPWIVMAGFVVASIPTLLVFLFCQRIILRGIIIPSMK